MLTRMQISAVKVMGRNIPPIEKKIERLQAKKSEIEAEIASLNADIDNINTAIENFTGGVSLQEILHPESAIPTTMQEDAIIDETATVEQVEITPTSVYLEEMEGNMAEEGPSL